jgi:hypothetical protein
LEPTDKLPLPLTLKNDRWLKLHPTVKFHFTPTCASWLNQVDWFSILQGQFLCDESSISVKPLREHIDDFVDAYKADAKAFVWSSPKSIKNVSKPVSRTNDSGYWGAFA